MSHYEKEQQNRKLQDIQQFQQFNSKSWRKILQKKYVSSENEQKIRLTDGISK
jgi:hypothetical protein